MCSFWYMRECNELRGLIFQQTWFHASFGTHMTPYHVWDKSYFLRHCCCYLHILNSMSQIFSPSRKLYLLIMLSQSLSIFLLDFPPSSIKSNIHTGLHASSALWSQFIFHLFFLNIYLTWSSLVFFSVSRFYKFTHHYKVLPLSH